MWLRLMERLPRPQKSKGTSRTGPSVPNPDAVQVQVQGQGLEEKRALDTRPAPPFLCSSDQSQGTVTPLELMLGSSSFILLPPLAQFPSPSSHHPHVPGYWCWQECVQIQYSPLCHQMGCGQPQGSRVCPSKGVCIPTAALCARTQMCAIPWQPDRANLSESHQPAQLSARSSWDALVSQRSELPTLHCNHVSISCAPLEIPHAIFKVLLSLLLLSLWSPVVALALFLSLCYAVPMWFLTLSYAVPTLLLLGTVCFTGWLPRIPNCFPSHGRHVGNVCEFFFVV